MTLAAGKVVAMPRVTERNRSGILDRKDTIRGCRGMTFFAVAGYTESSFAVMASATRLTLLHLQHRIADTAGSANKNRAVTFIALEHLEMVAVTKPGIKCFETDIHDVFMALLAIAFG